MSKIFEEIFEEIKGKLKNDEDKFLAEYILKHAIEQIKEDSENYEKNFFNTVDEFLMNEFIVLLREIYPVRTEEERGDYRREVFIIQKILNLLAKMILKDQSDTFLDSMAGNLCYNGNQVLNQEEDEFAEPLARFNNQRQTLLNFRQGQLPYYRNPFLHQQRDRFFGSLVMYCRWRMQNREFIVDDINRPLEGEKKNKDKNIGKLSSPRFRR